MEGEEERSMSASTSRFSQMKAGDAHTVAQCLCATRLFQMLFFSVHTGGQKDSLGCFRCADFF